MWLPKQLQITDFIFFISLVFLCPDFGVLEQTGACITSGSSDQVSKYSATLNT